jgi:hypothetical protein
MELKEPASFLGFDPGLTVGAFAAFALTNVKRDRKRGGRTVCPAEAGFSRRVDFRLTRG